MATSRVMGIGRSDGTFTQDPRARGPISAPQTPSVALQRILCDEMECRTRLACDALTDFQRIVALCVSERFGRWTFTTAPCAHMGSGWSCPRCGCTQEEFENHIRSSQAKGEGARAENTRGLFPLDGCRTPYCSAEELGTTSSHCRYAADVSALLERRYTFQQEFGSLLQRIHAASRGIQDGVTR
jgi:hypothetical protein